MYQFVLDADGLIKLTKSGLIHKIVNYVKFSISDQVFKEVVIKGKEKLYEDAFIVENIVKKGKIKKIKVKKFEINIRFSEGELSTLQLYREQKVRGIISDDRRFLSLLESEKIPFIVPTHLIAKLTKKNKIKKEDALKGLKAIREFVREDAYQEAIKYIGVSNYGNKSISTENI